MKKIIISLFVLMLAVSTVFAGGNTEVKSTGDAKPVVTTVCRASYADEEWYKNMNADFEAETGIHIEVIPTPGNDEDHDSLLNTWLLSGETIDVIPSLGPKFYQDRVEAGFFMPLNDKFAEAGIDAKGIWGANLQGEEDGTYYSVPTKQEVYCVFYNKDIFDEAGVAYPEGPWTWDEYIETAKKVTNLEKGIYGSYMNAENPWTIMPAKQQDVPLYKEDGTCNFDAPEFRDAIQWYYDLGNTLNVQMPVGEVLNENASWNYYAIAGDHLAMFPQGNWFTRLLNSQTDYPRDWKYGVAPLPSAPNGGDNNMVSLGYVSINKNSANPDLAFKYLVWLGENQWKYEGGIPALATLTEEQQNQVFSSIADASNGQVTVDDLYNAWINTGLGTAQSDIVGVAANEYNRIVNAELQAFYMDLQDIDTTIANIMTKVNQAIKNSK